MKTIVLNPGHGGPDPGCIGYSGSREANVAHAISHRAGALLENYFRVLNTRDLGAVELEDVVQLANEEKADIFVSIHCNAALTSYAFGLEVYYFKDSMKGLRLANTIYDSLINANVTSGYSIRGRGLNATYGLYVLRETAMPACLVECGFLTNPEEEKWLTSPLGQITIGFGIARGIMKYF
ncbi:MAG: N-acetylmuramoyl-L-alanine amidase [Candidatus Jordarchaeaceae archaeon]